MLIVGLTIVISQTFYTKPVLSLEYDSLNDQLLALEDVLVKSQHSNEVESFLRSGLQVEYGPAIYLFALRDRVDLTDGEQAKKYLLAFNGGVKNAAIFSPLIVEEEVDTSIISNPSDFAKTATRALTNSTIQGEWLGAFAMHYIWSQRLSSEVLRPNLVFYLRHAIERRSPITAGFLLNRKVENRATVQALCEMVLEAGSVEKKEECDRIQDLKRSSTSFLRLQKQHSEEELLAHFGKHYEFYRQAACKNLLKPAYENSTICEDILYAVLSVYKLDSDQRELSAAIGTFLCGRLEINDIVVSVAQQYKAIFDWEILKPK
jgi:hypothetical protein